MNADDLPLDAVRALLLQAGQTGPFQVQRLPGGGNNRVYRIDGDSDPLLLKWYFRHPNDPRDRLRTEFSFLTFALQHGCWQIPVPHGRDEAHGLALYQFLEGRSFAPAEVDRGAVEEAATFYRELNHHRNTSEARNLSDASEACFTLSDHLACVERRLARLRRMPVENELAQQAARFLATDIEPRWQAVRARIEKDFESALNEALPQEQRCLSPSDFGFHNALRVDKYGGDICFLDFEYAGWDDPAKLVCDFFCQPAVPVPFEYWDMFAGEVTADSVNADAERRHMDTLLPVYRLKWITILLNDFLPTEDERRRFARSTLNANERKASQLTKARAAFEAHFP